MSSLNGKIVYIDGFAGPGVYKGGEQGSPVIALNAAIKHKFPLRNEIVFYFIEADRSRFNVLSEVVEEIERPTNFKVFPVNARFDESLTTILSTLEEQRRRLAPTFAFIDPFGYSQTPFSLLKRLMSNRSCEVLITFMYEEINRIWDEADQKDHLDMLYGCQRPSLSNVRNPVLRMKTIHDLYISQLRTDAGIKYIRSFRMINQGNRTDYFLVFGTNKFQGMVKMKDSMWKVDQSGTFQFSDATFNPNQPTLFTIEPDFAGLTQQVINKFVGNEAVSIEGLEEFVVADTAFRLAHLRSGVLAPLEKAKKLEIVSSPRQKRFGYPAGTVLRFL